MSSDEGGVDPWLLTEAVIDRTTALKPVVAVQPASMHPHALATMISTFATLHARQVGLHWVAGGPRDGPDDTRSHEAQYERMVEYAALVRQLTDGQRVAHVGRYFGVTSVKLEPELPPALRPEYLVSGSCPLGVSAARALGALPLTCAGPPDQEADPPGHTGAGALKIGVIARSDRETAWRSALKRFPPARGSALGKTVAPKVSDSHWHLKLCRLAEERASSGDPYWLGPFEGYRSLYPYLVGSHEDVASALAAYLRRGFDTFVLDETESPSELEHASLAFELATGKAVVA